MAITKREKFLFQLSFFKVLGIFIHETDDKGDLKAPQILSIIASNHDIEKPFIFYKFLIKYTRVLIVIFIFYFVDFLIIYNYFFLNKRNFQ